MYKEEGKGTALDSSSPLWSQGGVLVISTHLKSRSFSAGEIVRRSAGDPKSVPMAGVVVPMSYSGRKG